MKYFNLFDIQAKAIIKVARELTVTFGQKEIEPELILLAILHTPKCTACEVLSSICGNTASMRLRLESKLMAKLPKGTDETNPGFSRRSVLLLTQSFQEMTRNNSGKICSEHILLAMCFERFGTIAKLFAEFEVSRNMIEMWLSARKQSKIATSGSKDEVDVLLASEAEKRKAVDKVKIPTIDLDKHPLIRFLKTIATPDVVYAVRDFLLINFHVDIESLKPIDIVLAVLDCETEISLKIKNELEQLGVKIESLKELKSSESAMLLFEGKRSASVESLLMLFKAAHSKSPTDESDEGYAFQYSSDSSLNLCIPVVHFVLGCALSASVRGETLLTPERIVVDYLKTEITKDEPFNQ